VTDRSGAAARERAGLVAMLAATALWGGTFVVLRDSVPHIAPTTLVFVRFTCATLVLGAIALARGARFDRSALRGGVLGGLAAAAGYTFQAVGLHTTSAGTSAFLTSAGTVLAGLLAWPLLRQRPTRELFIGIALVLFGSALLSGPRFAVLGAGEAWTMLGALGFALQVIALARDAGAADPFALVTVQSATMALALAPFSLGSGGSLAGLAALSPATLARLAYLVLAGSVIASFLQVWAQRVLPPGRVGLLFGLEPVFALLFAVAFGGERFGWMWCAGAAAILVGIAVVELPAARRRD
jgi:drug/metabolite transporter (DMT)-like permease